MADVGAYNADGLTPDMEPPAVQASATDKSDPVKKLISFIDMPNIVPSLKEEQHAEIAARVIADYEIDLSSRKPWLDRVEGAMQLAMLVADEKDYPFPRAANVKYPLLTTAALQFNARAYPAIVQGNRVVKCATEGDDPNDTKAQRADRVSRHMSYQLLTVMPEWEEDTDRLLVILPIVGCIFRKAYNDPSLGRNCTRLVTADRLVVNYRARSIEDVPRTTEQMWLYPHEIEERIRDGRFAAFEYDNATKGEDEGAKDDESDADDDDAPHLFLEQHRLWDLDGDGYKEPYIVTVHHGSEQLCRIVANYTLDSVRVSADGTKIASIRRQSFYTKYDFLPNPEGGFYGMGFGWLLKDIGESINTTLNEMLDAGHLSNVQGGLVSAALGLREKSIRLAPGEWKVLKTSADLKSAVMPISYPGPSDTLFKLLGLLVEAGKEVAAIKDVLTGEGQGKNASPTTTLALIEQGLQVFTSIYKRVHRALKAELAIHRRLNRMYLDAETYNRFFDGAEKFDPQQDYDDKDMDILPVSDPNVATRMQELAKAQFVHDTGAGNPLVNQEELLRRLWEAAQVPEIDKLLVPPPQPDPKELAFMDAMKKMSLLELKAKIEKMHTAMLLDVANTEAAEAGTQFGAYDQMLNYFTAEHGMEMDHANAATAAAAAPGGPGGVPGVDGQPNDPVGAPAPPGPVGGAGGGDQGAPVPVSPPLGAGQPMGGPPA